jgi:hypothetical protein
MIRSRFGVLAGVAVLPLLLGACGDSGLSSDDEDQITQAIELAATSGDPKACTEAQTQAFTEQVTGKSGEGAVKQCERDAKDTPADSVEVANIDGDEDSATADAAVIGSFFDGQTLQLALVKDGDQWKLDEAVGFKDFDRDAFTASLKKSFAEEGEAPAGAVRCVTKNLEKLSDQEIEDLFLNSNSDLEKQVFNPCFKGE